MTGAAAGWRGSLPRWQALQHALRRQNGDALGALAQLRFEDELAIMLGQDSLHDGEAEACSLFGALIAMEP